MSSIPALLKRQDTVAFVAPSRVIFEDQLSHAIDVFNSWGLNVKLGKAIYNQSGYFAGTDKERLSDFQEMIDDPTIKAIFCARGGYGMTRFLDSLDFSLLRKHPKWIVGFSDVTALHLKLDRLSIPSIHGLMPVQFGYDGVERSIESIYQILHVETGTYNVPAAEGSFDGETSANIVGGNLSLICDSLGTSSEINTNGKILFLEEIDEYLYQIDRMLKQLERAGKFNALAGVIVGDFTKVKDTEIPFGDTWQNVISGYFKNKTIPVAFGFPAGHEALHLALPLGRKITLSVRNQQCMVKY